MFIIFTKRLFPYETHFFIVNTFLVSFIIFNEHLRNYTFYLAFIIFIKRLSFLQNIYFPSNIF
jgi:hypothetical protein